MTVTVGTTAPPRRRSRRGPDRPLQNSAWPPRPCAALIGAGVEGLAESIAREGLLQNPVFETQPGAGPTRLQRRGIPRETCRSR